MTLRHFEIFTTVCQTRNMTAAAQLLYLSQPAVSLSIKELEEYYQIRVFDRLGKKLYLTPEGNRLLAYAQRILADYTDAGREMESFRKNMPLRIGVSVTIGTGLLPDFAVCAQKSTPPLLLDVVENNTREIQRLLLESKLDLALAEGEITAQELVQISFYQDTMLLLCGKSHPFYDRESIPAQALENERFLLREEGSGTRETFEIAMKKAGLSWHPAWVCSSVDTIKAGVIRGLGITVLSPLAVQSERKSGLLKAVSVEALDFTRQFKLVYHKQKHLTPAMQRFLDLILKESNLE